MPKHMVHKRAVCPYYRHESPQMIYCDGVMDETVTHLAFANRSVAVAYKKSYCRDRYEQCRIYQMLTGIYEEEDEI